jgi:hypothetical protein
LTVTTKNAAVDPPARGARCADDPLRGTPIVSVAVPGAGVAVGTGLGTGPTGAGVELPPPHPARKMSDATATARVIMVRRLRGTGYCLA